MKMYKIKSIEKKRCSIEDKQFCKQQKQKQKKIWFMNMIPILAIECNSWQMIFKMIRML